MKRLLAALALLLIPSISFGQTTPSSPRRDAQPGQAGDTKLATQAGSEVSVGVSGYNYIEPGELRISIHGAKFSGAWLGTFSISPRHHVFARADARLTLGNTSYDGWCMPWLIVPNSSSPNGYALDLGDPEACTDTGGRDWYWEGRGVVGRDFVGNTWTWSPEAGIGVRRLSNGLGGLNGFRTDRYLYLPFGLTARTRVGSKSVLGFNVEYDRMLRGWQNTHDSALGSGTIPATPTAPAFSIDGFTDISFDQHRGWALRASAKYQLNRTWSIEPYYVHWRVDASPVSAENVTFTVNGVRAIQQLGAYEPNNTTHEFGVKVGIRF